MGLLLAVVRRIPRGSAERTGRRGHAAGAVVEDRPRRRTLLRRLFGTSGTPSRSRIFQGLRNVARHWAGLERKAPSKALAAEKRGPEEGSADAGKAAASSGNAAPRQYFFNADEMKDKVRAGLMKETYNVADYYKTTGVFQKIARHHWFESLTLGVISLNAVWIGVDTDLNRADVLLHAAPIFQIADNFFCSFFFFEWVVRFLSFKKKRNALKDSWFIFDTALVTMMVLETWVMTAVLCATGGVSGGRALANASILRIFRLLRLSRLTRMIRLLRMMPELVILVKSMVAALRSVFFTFCLLFVMLYVFAITFRQLAGGNPVLSQLYFSSVPVSMYNLLIHGTFLDSLGSVVINIGAQSRVVEFIFWVFVLLSAFCVMNMLIGILCEVVSAVSATEREAILINFVKEKMQQLFAELDKSGDGLISRDEFLTILERREACQLLHEVGVDVIGLVDQVDDIFADDLSMHGSSDTERTLDFPKLMEVVLSLRGSCSATVKDVIDLRKFVRTVVGTANESLARIGARLDAMEQPITGSVNLLTSGIEQAASAALSQTEDEAGGEASEQQRTTATAGGDYASISTQEVADVAQALEHRLRSRTESLRALVGELEAELGVVRRLRARSEALAGALGPPTKAAEEEVVEEEAEKEDCS